MCCTISCCLCNGWMLFSDWRFATLCVMPAGRRCLPCHGGGCAATYLTSMLWHSSGIDGLKWAGDSIDSVGPCVMLMDLWVSRGSSWLVDMNSVTTYGNIGGFSGVAKASVAPEPLQVPGTNLYIGMRPQGTSYWSVFTHLQKEDVEGSRWCTIYGIWLCVISYDIYCTAMFYLSCALVLRCRRNSSDHVLQLFVYTRCPKIL